MSHEEITKETLVFEKLPCENGGYADIAFHPEYPGSKTYIPFPKENYGLLTGKVKDGLNEQFTKNGYTIKTD